LTASSPVSRAEAIVDLRIAEFRELIFLERILTLLIGEGQEVD
jgi:hypothetical protein